MELFKVYSLYDVEIVRAKGSKVWDKEGNEYLDMYGGHAVISIGHTNPRYVNSLKSQLDNIGFYSNSVIISSQNRLAELIGKVSGKEDYSLFLCNSGAEANENAMKLASFHTGRNLILTFTGSFHGRTSLAVEATDNKAILAPCNCSGNVLQTPFNDCEALQEIFKAKGNSIAAVMVEGIQGVGGIQIPTDDFLRTIRRLCNEYGAQMIADEVQSGCGRTGKYYAVDHAGISADIYTMAKGIGNGFPIGAISIAPHFQAKKGMLGTTFGGNHLAVAAAISVAEEILENNLIEKASEKGEFLMNMLRQELPSNKVKEIRGRGLMIGIELNEDSTEIRKELISNQRMFVGSAKNSHIIRLLPALTISPEECSDAVSRIKKLL